MTSAPPVSSPDVFRQRRERLARLLEERAAPAVALASGWARPRNFAHNVFPFRAESHFLYLVGAHLEGAVLAYRDGDFRLFVSRQSPEMDLWAGPEPSLEELAERLGLPVVEFDEFDLAADTATLPPQDEETAVWLSELLERPVVAQGGAELEGADASLAESMVELRVRHDAAALAQLDYAARVGAAAHRRGMERASSLEFEYEVRGVMESEFLVRGLGPSYSSIVTQHGEVLHQHRSSARLSPGELLLCDVGCETLEGFASDITRTFPTSGRFSPSQKAMYELVLSVQLAAIAEVRAGARFLELHRRSQLRMAEGLVHLGVLRGSPESLYETGAIAVFYPHGLGHLLGLDVHDMEDLGDRAGYAKGRGRSDHPSERALRLDRDLEPGMVVTIEPGFYRSPLLLDRAKTDPRIAASIDWQRLEAFSDVRGIRIEDDVQVLSDGARVLSGGAPKEVAAIEELAAARDST